MRKRRSVFTVSLVAAALFVACGLPSSDEFSSGARDGGPPETPTGIDGGAVDGGGDVSPTADSGDADTGPSLVNLVTNPGYEDGTCGSSEYFHATGGPSKDAHTGTTACQSCRESEAITGYSLDRYDAIIDPPVGKRIRARAWIKQGKDSFKPQQVSLVLRTYQTNPFTQVELSGEPKMELTGDWQLLESSLDITKQADRLDYYAEAATEATAGERCLLLDDIELWIDDAK